MMAPTTLIVTRIKRSSSQNNISHLSGGATAWESPSFEVKQFIELGRFNYRVRTARGPLVEVVNLSNGGWYLRSQPDDSGANNLESLPTY